jgi:hypothetical protein
MRKLLCLFFLLFPVLAYAQETSKPDSLLQQGVGGLSAGSEAVSDSLQRVKELSELPDVGAAIDSLSIKHKLDSI